VLYRQFEGKEELFSATLLTPFLDTSKEFVTAWRDQIEHPWDDEQLVREFVRDLYTNLIEHRRSLVTLLAASEDSASDLLAQMRANLEGSLVDVRLIAEEEADRRQWFSRESVAASSSLVVALIGGLVLLKPLLSSGDDDAEAVIDAATRLALHGMRLEP
jgi:AcrR family transcriptional regulator